MSIINKRPSSRNNFFKKAGNQQVGTKFKGTNKREPILTLAKNTCQCCSRTKKVLEKIGRILTIHHIVPIENGGLATENNALVCCNVCHQQIHKFIFNYGITNNFLEYLKIYLLSSKFTHSITLVRYGLSKKHKAVQKNPNILVGMYQNILDKRLENSDNEKEKAA